MSGLVIGFVTFYTVAPAVLASAVHSAPECDDIAAD
jgi:hypothetical protein